MGIKLPDYNWFKNSKAKKGKPGNPFAGSYGTDHMKGFMNKRIFNYKVLLMTREDDSLAFTVESYVMPPYSAGVRPEKLDFEAKEFDGSEEQLAEVEKYLMERAERLI